MIRITRYCMYSLSKLDCSILSCYINNIGIIMLSNHYYYNYYKCTTLTTNFAQQNLKIIVSWRFKIQTHSSVLFENRGHPCTLCERTKFVFGVAMFSHYSMKGQICKSESSNTNFKLAYVLWENHNRLDTICD